MAWPSVRMPCGSDAGGQLGAGERARLGDSVAHDRHGAVGVLRRDALLAQAPAAVREAGRSREREQPRVVVAMDEVQRAAVQPRDHELLVALDGRRGQALAACAQGQGGGAAVLGLDGEQAAHERGRAQPLAPVQELGARAGAG